MTNLFHVASLAVLEDEMAVEGFRLRLEEYLDEASGAEKNLIEFILARPNDCLGRSIQELANLSYTSPSTIVRFCKKVGCNGYREFQQALVFEMALQQRNAQIAMTAVNEGDSTEEIVRKVTVKNMESLEASMRLVDPVLIDHCVDLIEKARVVNLWGIGSSLLVAKDFQHKLLRIDKPCNLCEDWHSQLLYAMNMEPGDLGIAITYSGQTREVIECARVAKHRGATVIAITRSGVDSQIIHTADCVLEVASTELVFRSSAASSRITQLNMIDILFATYASRNYERTVKRISSNYIKKPFGDDSEGPVEQG